MANLQHISYELVLAWASGQQDCFSPSLDLPTQALKFDPQIPKRTHWQTKLQLNTTITQKSLKRIVVESFSISCQILASPNLLPNSAQGSPMPFLPNHPQWLWLSKSKRCVTSWLPKCFAKAWHLGALASEPLPLWQ